MEPTTGPYQSKRKSILRRLEREKFKAVALGMVKDLRKAGVRVARKTERALRTQ